MENKLAHFEEWSHMSMGLRYRAGAMGIPFMPSRSMMGSDVSAELGADFKTIDCPSRVRRWWRCRRSIRTWH